MLRRSLIDLRPLSDKRFRGLWLGSALSQLGGQMTAVAIMLQLWDATGSTVWTGAVGIAHAVPMLLIGLWGGALADRLDRRKIALVCTVGACLASAALAAQAFAAPLPPAALLAVVAGQTACNAVSGPARRTFVTRLLPPDLVAPGMALTQIAFQASMLLGPAIAGVVAAWWGIGVCYVVDAVSFCASFVGVFGLPAMRVTGEAARSMVRSVIEGVAFVGRNRLIRAAFLTDLMATVLAMPVSLFPALNAQRFAGSPGTLGLFLSAIAVGGIVASLFSGSFTRSARPGIVMSVAAVVWGLALAAVGLVDSGWAALVLLVVAGAADTVSVVSRGTMVQVATPDALRGRVGSAELLVGSTGPDLGNIRGGLVAGATSVNTAFVAGGLACAVGVVVVVGWLRDLVGYRPPERVAADAAS